VKNGIWVMGACAVTLAAAGCGTRTIDGRKVQNQIQSQAAGPPFNLSVAGVRCPTHRAAKKNDTFTCTMSLTNGETVPFKITQLDAKGDVSIRLGNEIATFVEATINHGLARRGFKVRSTCPRHVPVVAGRAFTCSVVLASGRHGTVPVPITDSSGAFAPGRGRVG
jgi:hypothetical protein